MVVDSFTSAAQFEKDQQQGKLRRVSPEELDHALVLHIADQIRFGGDEDTLQYFNSAAGNVLFFFAFLACFLSTAYVPLCFRAIFLSVRQWKTVALSISLRVELAETYEAAFWKAINLRHADENAQHYLCMFAVLLVPLTLGVLKKRLTPGVLNKRLTLGVLNKRFHPFSPLSNCKAVRSPRSPTLLLLVVRPDLPKL